MCCSFPGGMVSEGDSNSIQTALRESEEELGLNLNGVDVWGSMLPLPYKVWLRAGTKCGYFAVIKIYFAAAVFLLDKSKQEVQPLGMLTREDNSNYHSSDYNIV